MTDGAEQARVAAWERTDDQTSDPLWMAIERGRGVVAGREGELALGADPLDRGVSRRAVVVTLLDDGWHLEVPNANGAVIHPCGLAPYPARPTDVVRWPRVGIRVLNGDDSTVRWVLLESDADALRPHGRTADPSRLTDVAKTPRALSPRQMEALRTVFATQLAWPPQLGSPLQLKQAARRLGVSDSAVQNLLTDARDRATSLGLVHAVGLTHPEYLHVLVAAGYVRP